MKILAFDPGGTTGVCGWRDDVGVTMQDQIATEGRHNVPLYASLQLVMPTRVVCERFDYHGGRGHVELISRNYIGVIELWCDQNDIDLIMQKPSDMTFWDDDKMKKTGLYKPGLPHANDATRHMLQYVTFTLKDHRHLNLLRPKSE